MKKRFLIEMPKKNDFKWGCVRFEYAGEEREYVCNVNDWKIYKIKEKMFYDYNVPEEIIDELCELAYRKGESESINDESL